MKFSIAVSILILAVGGAIGLMHQKRLNGLQADYHELTDRAERLGIATTMEDTTGARVTKRQRDEGASKSQAAMTAELVAIAKEMELQEKSGKEPDAVLEKRTMDLMLQLMDMDSAQLKSVISGLRDEQSLSVDSRRNMIGFSILMLGEDHPAAALALFSESSDLLGESDMGQHVLSASLASWAQENPAAALAWMNKNAAEHPELANDDAKRSIIEGAARTDPALAFKLLGEMKMEDASDAIHVIVEGGKTPEQRTAILQALRGHLATVSDESERNDLLEESLEDMGRNISGENIDSVKSWIEKAKLSPGETAQFAAGLSYFNTKQDTGQWIDWMAQTLPEEQLKDNVDNLIGQWTQQDYLSAGKWLSASPEGPAKNAAVATYAGTVAEYEPQTAVQWALTMPAGEERQETFEAIYRNWPKSDAAAAEAFAKEHGVDPEKAKEEP